MSKNIERKIIQYFLQYSHAKQDTFFEASKTSCKHLLAKMISNNSKENELYCDLE